MCNSFETNLEAADINLEGRVYMITGASTEAGYADAEYIAKKKATLYIVVENKEIGEKNLQSLIDSSGNNNIFLLVCDCSLEVEVRSMWNQFEEHRKSSDNPTRLNCLICNFNTFNKQFSQTLELVERTFAEHVLFGCYLLTNLAIPFLASTEDARVIVVSDSLAYVTNFPSWEIGIGQANIYNGAVAYAYAKRAQLLLCEKWSQMHSSVKFVACHLGWMDIPHTEYFFPDIKKNHGNNLRTVYEGAQGLIWLSVTKINKLQSGEFYLDRSVRVKHIAGPFFSEGSYTKNSKQEIEDLFLNLELRSCYSVTTNVVLITGVVTWNTDVICVLRLCTYLYIYINTCDAISFNTYIHHLLSHVICRRSWIYWIKCR